MANKWGYEFDCRNCDMIQFIDDPARHRHGDYCTAVISGKKTIHADDDFVLRCDCYIPQSAQISLFDMKG